MEHSKQMIRVQIEYHDGTTRQFLTANWEQILRLYSGINVKNVTVYAITPREVTEYQKKIEYHNLGFMRVVR